MKILKEFKIWLKARYKPNLDRSKDLRDKLDKKIKIIEENLNNE